MYSYTNKQNNDNIHGKLSPLLPQKTGKVLPLGWFNWVIGEILALSFVKKTFKVKNNYWDGTANPAITGFQCFRCHKLIISCPISLFSLRRDMGKRPSEIKKIAMKWNWCSNGSNSLVSDHFEFSLFLWCLASWKMHNDTLLEIWVFVTPWRKTIRGLKVTQGVKLQTLLC